MTLTMGFYEQNQHFPPLVCPPTLKEHSTILIMDFTK
jgi:hypothetical protein